VTPPRYEAWNEAYAHMNAALRLLSNAGQCLRALPYDDPGRDIIGHVASIKTSLATLLNKIDDGEV